MTRRFSVTKVFLIVTLIAVAFCIGFAAPYPERWNEELVGLRRTEAWRLLGVPDIVYTEKFDGWNRDAIIGAWVLIVRYDKEKNILEAKRKFDWGFGYLSWDDDYHLQWKRPNLKMKADD